LDGLQQEDIATGADIGEATDLPAEQLPTPETDSAVPAAQA
ncbi:MAG: hypothetical protein QOK29_3794, partial [Rhodospirillaceae bacterium]|nr:hypothetical protein [Rhodospirillaceae bacterium]